MINVRGIPVADVEVWGWPWHGRMIQPSPGSYAYQLQRHDGAVWPLFDLDPDLTRIPESLWDKLSAYSLSTEGLASFAGHGGTTHLVKTHGHTFAGRTPEQVVSDVTRSHEWLGSTMMCGIEHAVYMTQLGWYQWIYSLNGKRWLMKVAVDSVPHPLSAPTTDLALTISARPFGEFGVEGEWFECGQVEADSCCTSGFAWHTPSITLADQPPVLIQSIKSDGGKLILEVRFYALPPSRMQSGPVGFYSLDVSNIGTDSWSLDLALLKSDTDIITKSIVSSGLSQGIGSVGIDSTDTSPYERVHTPYLIPAGDATALYCTGTIVQEQRRHCGFVFDADDVLHEMVCVITASHDCDVGNDPPTFTGTAVQVLDGSGHIVSTTNSIMTTESFSTSVETTITVEMERDGATVSSVSCVIEYTKAASYTYQPIFFAGQAPSPTPDDVDLRRTAKLTVGSYTATFDKSDLITTGIPGGDKRRWPEAGLFDGSFFASLSGVTLTPWPDGTIPGAVVDQPIEAKTYRSDGSSNSTTGLRIRFGAARLSNNVWVPVIVAGRPGAVLDSWLQVNDGFGYSGIEGMPSTVFGPRVGPDVNGPAQDDFVPVAGVGPLRIDGGAYDFLHGVTLPYADIF